MITDAGRAHLAAIAAQRQANRGAWAEERRLEGLASIDVGNYVWQRPAVEGDRIRNGLVADIDADGLVVLDPDMAAHGWVLQVKRADSRHYSSRLLVAVRRVPVEAVEVAEPRTGRALVEYARACWATAGVRTGELTDDDLALVQYGSWLAAASLPGRAS